MGYLKDELRGFVPTEQAKEIMKDVARGSSLLRLSKVEKMESDKKKFPVMTEGPGAYWVSEGERIKTSKAGWIFPEIEAKKLAVIIPVTKEKLNDTTIAVFEELKGAIAEAFYTAIDAAGFFGINSPFKKNIYSSAVNAGNIIVRDNAVALDLDISDVMALIEDSGLDVNGFTAHYGLKNSLRKLRDNNGNQLFVDGVNQKELYSNPIEFSRNGSWDKTKGELIAADWNKSIVGIREGIEYEILKEATLQGTIDSDGKPISLAEQDLIAIKATMRLGHLPIKDEAFALLVPEKSNLMGTLSITVGAGSDATHTKVTEVNGNTGSGKLKYKVSANITEPSYGDEATEYSDLKVNEDIECSSSDKIIVVESSTSNKIVAKSSVTSVEVGS